MGKKVSLCPTRNKEEIMYVLSSPGIWENISGDDYIDPSTFNIRFDLKTLFILGKIEDEIIGCVILHKEHEWKVHLNIIPKYRKDYAIEFADLALDWIWERIHPNKIVAEIHPKFQNVIKFAENKGFEQIESDSEKNMYQLMRPENGVG